MSKEETFEDYYISIPENWSMASLRIFEQIWNHQQEKLEAVTAERDEYKKLSEEKIYESKVYFSETKDLRAKLEVSEKEIVRVISSHAFRVSEGKKLKIAVEALEYYKGIAVKELGLIASEALEKIKEMK